MSGFHGAFATGVASQQGTLTLPDTWFRPPIWDLLMLQLLRLNSSNLPCLYSTFHLEYPLVLYRFCFRIRHSISLVDSRSQGDNCDVSCALSVFILCWSKRVMSPSDCRPLPWLRGLSPWGPNNSNNTDSHVLRCRYLFSYYKSNDD